MSRFDEILDDVIYKARVAADVAGKKTNEMVEMGKLKYKAKQASWDIEKAYAKLGALVYEARKNDESYDDIITLAVDELDILNDKLDKLEERLAYMKTPAYKEQRDATRPVKNEYETEDDEPFEMPGEAPTEDHTEYSEDE